MNHQTSHDPQRNFEVAEAEISFDHTATSASGTESNCPNRSQGKIPISTLLNPVNETTVQSDAKILKEDNRQQDKNEEPDAIRPAREVEVVGISLTGHPSSAVEGKKTAHEANMTNEAITCPVCEEAFSDPADLKTHEEVTHSEPRTTSGYGGDITCEICYKDFKYASNLESHKKKAHHGTPIAFCDKCPANFTSTRSLSFHKWEYHCQPKLNGPLRRMKHNPYQCTQCGFKSRKKIVVTRHENMIHGDVDQPKFPCTYDCGYVGDSEPTRDFHELYCQKKPKRD